MTPNSSNKSDLLTVREVAGRLRVDETTVRRWIGQGVLQAIPLPHKGKRQSNRIQQSELDKVLAGETNDPKKAAL